MIRQHPPANAAAAAAPPPARHWHTDSDDAVTDGWPRGRRGAPAGGSWELGRQGPAGSGSTECDAPESSRHLTGARAAHRDGPGRAAGTVGPAGPATGPGLLRRAARASSWSCKAAAARAGGGGGSGGAGAVTVTGAAARRAGACGIVQNCQCSLTDKSGH
jgi:hypothetical protein